MITDFVINFCLSVWNFFVGLLPNGSTVTIPGLDVLNTWLARLDSFVPIAGPLALMLGLLSSVVVFMTFRLAVTAWNVVKP